MESSIPHSAPGPDDQPADQPSPDPTFAQLRDSKPETAENQHRTPPGRKDTTLNDSAPVSSTGSSHQVPSEALGQPPQPIVEQPIVEPPVVEVAANQEAIYNQHGLPATAAETIPVHHVSSAHQEQSHVVTPVTESTAQEQPNVVQEDVPMTESTTQEQPHLLEGEAYPSSESIVQEQSHVVQEDAAPSTESTSQEHDASDPALTEHFEQFSDSSGNENQEIAHHTYPSVPYATGLDVDSNPTETEPSDDGDSAIGQSVYSSTFSTNSSVYDFVQENGRTYHRFKEGKYHLPNDEIEKDRLDLQHHLCNMAFDSLFLAPIDTEGGVQDVLDIATGTGIWAIEFAEQFPAARIIGTDLSPIQPDYVPPNLHFEVDDAEDPWVYSHPFDYIHGRMLVTCFDSHLAVFKSAFDFLKPGGWLELQDVSFPFLGADMKWNGSAFQRWMGLLMDGAKGVGKDWNQVPRYKDYLIELGFVDVVEKKIPCPIGPWAKGQKNKTLGVWGRANVLQSLGGLSLSILTRGLGMTPQQIELLLVDVRKDLNADGSESLHLYAPMYVVYGRKPF